MKKVIIAEDSSCIYAETYAYQFTEKEFRVIFPLIEKQIDKKMLSLQKKIDYYVGLVEWDATEKQQTKLFEYKEKYAFFEHIKKSF